MAIIFLAAVRKYFGIKPEHKGQAGLKGFAAEIKELTPEDREEIKALLSVELNEEVTT